MRPKKFAFAWSQIMMAAVAVLEIIAWLSDKQHYWILVVLVCAVVVAAIYFSSRELANSQNEAADARNRIVAIQVAVRATDNAPPTLRQSVAELIGGLWWLVIEMYKAENVPPPQWSTDIHQDFAVLTSGFQAATDRRNSLMNGGERIGLSEQYILVRSQLFDLRLTDGSRLLSESEIQLLQNMSTDKAILEEQARCLQGILPRIGSTTLMGSQR